MAIVAEYYLAEVLLAWLFNLMIYYFCPSQIAVSYVFFVTNIYFFLGFGDDLILEHRFGVWKMLGSLGANQYSIVVGW